MYKSEAVSIQGLSQRWLKATGDLVTLSWMALVVAAIAWGWWNRDEDFVTAERGLGYWLGIIGGSMMLLLLTYSLRKRAKFMKRLFSVKFWFRFHMLLGILGPMAILFHSNFHLGSLNSTVALVCMLLVAGSGFAGRYLYTRIHYGLYGEKVKLQEMEQDFISLKEEIGELAETEKQKAALEKLNQASLKLFSAQKNNPSVFRSLSAKRQAKKISRGFEELLKHLDQYHMAKARSKKGEDQMLVGNRIEIDMLSTRLRQESKVLFVIFRRLPGLHLFESLFSLWHVVHIPIFIMMIITAVTHVVVVHMY